MRQLPLVSVYITNYNYGRFIEQAINSVLNQTLKDFELIIIDDGSTDNSKNVIEQYRDVQNVSIIYNMNVGLNVNNNIALSVAKGKYLMRLDADDYLSLSAIGIMSAILEADPEIGLVFPDYYYVDELGNVTGEERRHNFEREVTLFDQPAHGACTMVRTEFLRALGGYYETFKCQDGYDLWIKFISNYKITNINKSLFYYRRHNNNLTINEERILSTRRQIKSLYVEKNLIRKKNVALIPVRNSFIGDVNWPFLNVSGKSIIELKVEECLKSSKIDYVVVSTSESELYERCTKMLNNLSKVHVIQRPREYASYNETLTRTVKHALQFMQDNKMTVETVVNVSLEYPFITADVLEEAVDTLLIFNCDTVLSVRPDNRMFYQHNGKSLKPILNQEKYTKFERESLYRNAGGLIATTIENIEKNDALISGVISHIVIERKKAFGVTTNFDVEVVKMVLEKD